MAKRTWISTAILKISDRNNRIENKKQKPFVENPVSFPSEITTQEYYEQNVIKTV